MPSGAVPKNTRSGGCSASTSFSIGRPRWPRVARGRRRDGPLASRPLADVGVGRAAGWRARAEEPAQSVENPPGSISVTWMPKPGDLLGQRLADALQRPLRRVVRARRSGTR